MSDGSFRKEERYVHPSRRHQDQTWKSEGVTKTIHDEILPILEDQPGFVDEVLLVSSTEPDQILALSFWKSQQDAERYTHEEYPRINGLISHLVESAPVFKTFHVDIFTSHKIRARKVA